MKRKSTILKFLFILIIPLLGFKKDKCNSDPLYEQGLAKLKKFSVLKDFRVYMKKKKKVTAEDYEYVTVALNRGVNYKFQALSSPEFEGKLVMCLYNNPDKQVMFATTLSQGTGAVRESLEFKCQGTGNYCIGYYFLDGLEGCGVGITAFQQ